MPTKKVSQVATKKALEKVGLPVDWNEVVGKNYEFEISDENVSVPVYNTTLVGIILGATIENNGDLKLLVSNPVFPESGIAELTQREGKWIFRKKDHSTIIGKFKIL